MSRPRAKWLRRRYVVAVFLVFGLAAILPFWAYGKLPTQRRRAFWADYCSERAEDLGWEEDSFATHQGLDHRCEVCRQWPAREPSPERVVEDVIGASPAPLASGHFIFRQSARANYLLARTRHRFWAREAWWQNVMAGPWRYRPAVYARLRPGEMIRVWLPR